MAQAVVESNWNRVGYIRSVPLRFGEEMSYDKGPQGQPKLETAKRESDKMGTGAAGRQNPLGSSAFSSIA
jgi:hypothetical protein